LGGKVNKLSKKGNKKMMLEWNDYQRRLLKGIGGLGRSSPDQWRPETMRMKARWLKRSWMLRQKSFEWSESLSHP
jgi:hypothetical protein